MADSVLPAFGSWWQSSSRVVADGITLPAGATSTPYDNNAVPVGSKRWSVELTYTTTAAATLSIRHNHFNAGKSKIRQTPIDDFPLSVGSLVTRRIDFVLTDTEQPNWLPSLASVGGDITIKAVSVYETPAPAGPTVTVWDGRKEVPATISVWDGRKEVACTVEVFNG
nr:MAG TPA: hypothetical protein [Caudoviricetes sp.]